MWSHDWRTAGSDVILRPAADNDDLPGLAAGGEGSASMVSYFEKPIIISEGIHIVRVKLIIDQFDIISKKL